MNKIKVAHYLKSQQQTIRELSPDYLSQNPPMGIEANLAAITAKYGPVKYEFRRPFARIPDELDERQECDMCDRTKTCWITEEQSEQDCPYCGAAGELPFMPNQVLLTVWRNWHSIETLAVVLDTGEVNAWVSVNEPGFPRNSKMELTEEEKELARLTVKRR